MLGRVLDSVESPSAAAAVVVIVGKVLVKRKKGYYLIDSFKCNEA